VKEVVVETCEACPAPTVDGLAVITGGASAGFTVMAIGLGVKVTDGDPVSVTWSSKDQDPTVVRIPVELDVGDEQVEEPPRLLYPVAPGAF